MASCSCGKDSVAMIELIIDHGLQLDEIVFAEVEKSFPQELEFMKFLIKRWEDMGYKCTVLKTEDTWDNWFFGEVTRGSAKSKKRGFPLTAFPCWWSREAKFKILDEHMKDGIRYIGIAADEPKRYHPEKRKEGYRYPLVDFQYTEIMCRKLCEERGVLNPLYKYFKRLGCYLCPKQRRDSLKNLFLFFPDQWEELKYYAKMTVNKEFASPETFSKEVDYRRLLELQKEFKNENEIEENQMNMF